MGLGANPSTFGEKRSVNPNEAELGDRDGSRKVETDPDDRDGYRKIEMERKRDRHTRKERRVLVSREWKQGVVGWLVGRRIQEV